MMIDALFDLVQLWLLPLTAIILLVLILRRPARQLFGAGSAYALWLLVPAGLAGTLLPITAPVPEVLVIHNAWLPSAPASMFDAVIFEPMHPGLLAVLWVLGAVLVALTLIVRQVRFVRDLGPLKQTGQGLWRTSKPLTTPVLIGLLRPRIIIPSDFESRYSERQQMLIIHHEHVHRRRGDPWFNAIAVTLLVLFWFHPLVHWALRCFRNDQEMACDARVLARFPQWRRSYAEALIPVDRLSPLRACHWSSIHPLKERLHMLNKSSPTRRKRATGLVMVMILALWTAGTIWSSAASGTGEDDKLYFMVDYQVDLTQADHTISRHSEVVIGVHAGQTGTIATDLGEAGTLVFELGYELYDEDLVDVAMAFILNGETISTPAIRFPIESPDGARIMIGQEGAPAIDMNIVSSRTRPTM
jgi:beta-lactamase regulating signal transducer with metallopeptidase domain